MPNTIDSNRSTLTRADALTLQKCNSGFIEQVYTSRRVPLANGGDASMDVYIPRDEGDYLYSLVRLLRPNVSIEVGMANGLSSVFIAQALQDNGAGRHIAIDPFQSSDWGGAGLAMVEKAGLAPLVELMELPSHQALPEIERSGVKAQFAFIDGSHLFDYVLTDFLCVDRLLDVGGLIAFDDSDWPAIESVIRYAITNRHYEVAFPEVVIENAHFHPTASARALRRLSGASEKLATKFRPDFLQPSYELGIRGRCVVLRKQADDDRDSQSKFHQPF